MMLIDEDDMNTFLMYSWHLKPMNQGSKIYYCHSSFNGKNWLFHRLIMQAKTGQMVDHINGNPLDNRKSNLRFVTPSQSQMNKGSCKRYKGVYRARDKWVAEIQKNGRRYRLGRYNSEECAAAAYNGAAIVLFENYGRLNSLGSVPQSSQAKGCPSGQKEEENG